MLKSIPKGFFFLLFLRNADLLAVHKHSPIIPVAQEHFSCSGLLSRTPQNLVEQIEEGCVVREPCC